MELDQDQKSKQVKKWKRTESMYLFKSNGK